MMKNLFLKRNRKFIDQGITNDLKEFGVDTDEPDLFNSDHKLKF